MQRCKKKFRTNPILINAPPKKLKLSKKNQLKQKIIKQVKFLTIQTF